MDASHAVRSSGEWLTTLVDRCAEYGCSPRCAGRARLRGPRGQLLTRARDVSKTHDFEDAARRGGGSLLGETCGVLGRVRRAPNAGN